MYRHGIRHLPIVDKKNNLVGIITQNTLLQVLDTQKDLSAVQILQEQLEVQTTQLKQLQEELQQARLEIERGNTCCKEELRFLSQIEIQINFQANVLAHVSDGVIAIDNEARILYLNKRAEQLYNIKADECIGRHLEEVYEYRWLNEKDKYFAHNALLTKGWWQGENIHIKKNGEEIYVDLSISFLKDSSGKRIGLLTLIRDITQRKEVEKALKESKERYRDLAQKLHSITVNTPFYIYELDRNGRIIFANRTCDSFPQGQALGTLMTDLFPQEQRSSIESTFKQVFRTEQVQEVEYAISNQEGEVRYYKTQIAPNRVEGKATTIVLIAIDITQRKLAEEKIAQQAALLDVTTDAILLRSLSGEILYYNQGAESMYGWTSEEAIGQVADELLYNEVSPELTEAFKTVTQKNSWQGELHKVTKEGKEIIVSSRWTLVKDKQGKPKSILTVDTDITEKKQLEQQFLRTQRLESLGTLASGIAHDLNNILTPILAVSQLLPLKVTNLDRSSQDMLKMLESSAKRGSNLVKQVLSFARGNEARRRVLQVKHLLRDIEQFVKGTFPKSIEIERNLPRDLWTVSADPTQLHQVLMNLVVNARDAMSDGGTLSITAENMFVDESYARMNIEAKVGPYVVVTIADTGVGIPPENIDRIFDPFFTTKEVGEGTGLGLSTVLGIIKNHGGFVKISSEVGKGSQFKVYLPSQEGLVYDKQQEPQPLVGQGELILVIDDEAEICEIIQTTLETYNLQVLTAKDGIEGISVYATYKNEISVVLTDMVMPIMDGEITIRTLQRINPQVKIIAISGLASTEALARAAGVGTQGFLAKPFTAQELLKAVAGVLSESD